MISMLMRARMAFMITQMTMTTMTFNVMLIARRLCTDRMKALGRAKRKVVYLCYRKKKTKRLIGKRWTRSLCNRLHNPFMSAVVSSMRTTRWSLRREIR